MVVVGGQIIISIHGRRMARESWVGGQSWEDSGS
jgi:hypothetical protein